MNIGQILLNLWNDSGFAAIISGFGAGGSAGAGAGMGCASGSSLSAAVRISVVLHESFSMASALSREKVEVTGS